MRQRRLDAGLGFIGPPDKEYLARSPADDDLDESSVQNAPAQSNDAPPAVTASKLVVETLTVKKLNVKNLRVKTLKLAAASLVTKAT